MTALAGIKDTALVILNRLRAAVKTIGDGRAELDMADRTFDRIAKKIGALPSSAPQKKAADSILARLRADVSGLREDAATHQRAADALFVRIKKDTGLGNVDGLLGLLGALTAFLAGVGVWWKSLNNETKRIDLESRKLEGVLNDLLPPDVISKIDQQSGGFRFNFGAMGIAAAALLLVLAGGRR